ncbi:MAG: serine/threonine-protein kinase [Candidatus Margulisiibacteriota bacterium]|jgi:serine/threonine-protein kinase
MAISITERVRHFPIIGRLFSPGGKIQVKGRPPALAQAILPPGPPSLAISDKIIGDRYTLGEPIGKGGLGHIYQGTDLKNNTPIVIKEIYHQDRPDLVQHESMIGYWAAYGPNVHPNVARFLGLVNGPSGKPYQIFEYIPGQTLDSELQTRGPLTINETLMIMEQVCSALIYLRDQGIVHCDIKPNNILYDRAAGKATVIDLGIAVATNNQALVGSPAFSPPEQLQKKAVDERADIFAIGVTMYDLLSGTDLTENKAILQRNWKVRTKSFPAHLPDQLADLIIRMTHPNKQNRSPNLETVLNELSALRQTPPLSN